MARKQQNPAPVDGAVVERLRQQVQAAKALASVPDQDLLADPRLNPHTRDQADELTAQRLSIALELEHKRQMRRAREDDRVEEEAARAAQAVAAATRATEPARSVLNLTRSRGRYVAGALGASIVLSIGSAMGLEAWVQSTWPTAPDGIGYLGEIALTGMATAAIAWRGKLAQAQTTLDSTQDRLFAAMIAVPLLASIVGSTAGSGPVGAVCSIGAALFAWFGYLVSVTGSTAVDQAMGRMRARTTPAATVVTEDTPQAAAADDDDDEATLAQSGIGDIENWLSQGDTESDSAAGAVALLPPPDPDDPGPDGTSGAAPASDATPGDQERPAQCDTDAPMGDNLFSRTQRLLAHHPHMSAAELAEELGCSRGHAGKLARQARDAAADAAPQAAGDSPGDTAPGER
ncbi:hypothetical protein GCM10027570_31120 [Streptomonospora sediminis]